MYLATAQAQGATTTSATTPATAAATVATPPPAPQPLDYGDWFTGGTLLVAIIVLILDVLARRKQAAIDLRRQAARVVAWVDLVESDDPPFPNSRPLKVGRVFVQNTSDEPVFACVVTVRPNPEVVKLRRSQGFPVDDEVVRYYRTIPPGVTSVEGLSLTPSPTPAAPASDLEKHLVRLEFTDSAGVRWRRGFGGLPLERLPGRQRHGLADLEPALEASDGAEDGDPSGSAGLDRPPH